MDGNLLKEVLWDGTEKIELAQTPAMENLSDKITVTTIYRGYSLQNAQTYFDIPRGSSWTFKSAEHLAPSSNYDVEFTFINEPEHDAFLISNQWTGYGVSGYSGLIESKSLPFYSLPARCFFSFSSENWGAGYQWVNNITEEHYEVDFSNIEMMTAANIDLGNALGGYSTSLHGFSQPENHYDEDFWLNRNRCLISGIDSVAIYYPLGEFPEYHTEISVYDDMYPNKWGQETYGDISETFTRIDADFTIIDNSKENFTIEATGTYDIIKSNWWDMENWVAWEAYSPSGLTHYTLPEPCPLALERYPDFGLNLYDLSYVSLIDHTQISSYKEIIEIQFNSPDLFFDVINDMKTRVKHSEENRSRQIEEEMNPHMQGERYYDQPFKKY
jgi:hypothetical protein